MRFTLLVCQCDGQISDRKEHTLADVQGTEVGRRLVLGFDQLLDEHLPQLRDGVVNVDVPIVDGGRGALSWRQPNLYSAMAGFFIENKLHFTWH